MTDFISLPFYDLFHEHGHVPEIRERLPARDTVVSEEEIVGHAYRPVWETIQAELVGAGFVQAGAPEGLLARRLG